ncbi:MAG: VWA domain-containing protein [Terriglobia bacterium]
MRREESQLARLLRLTPRCTSRNKLKVDWGRHSAFGVGVAFFLAAGLGVIRAPVRAQAPQKPESPEMKSDETEPTFTVQARRNEVLVRVVVRDKNGEAVGNLTQDDFRLYDDGKPQALTLFSLEHGAVATDRGVTKAAAIPGREPALQPPPPIAQRYVAFYFDDVVMAFEDVVRTRDATERYLKSSLQATDRAGIFTSSGVGNLEFTDDRDKLHEALARLKPQPITTRPELDCPPLSPYEAYLIAELRDQHELDIATLEVIQCACGGDPSHCLGPQRQAETEARVVWNDNELQARQSLRALTSLARRLGALPGQRSILWVSPGFLALTLNQELGQLTERALRNRVVINALDARGLYAIVPGGDATQSSALPLSPLPNFPNSGPAASARLVSIQSTGQSMNTDVMAELARDTGGIFFHNSNDYDAGFRKAGGLPEFSYLLTFSPPELKYNGKYHKLKVELMDHPNYSVQARRGYFAPNRAVEASRRADEEIEDAVFAQEEMRELRVGVQTQFFKVNEQIARLSVVARIDLESLRLRKENDRNLGDLKIVCAAFDRDGNLVAAKQRHLELRLRDATLARLLPSGLNIKTSLDLKAGTYLLRVVVHEAGSDRLSALNQTVEIPY